MYNKYIISNNFYINNFFKKDYLYKNYGKEIYYMFICFRNKYNLFNFIQKKKIIRYIQNFIFLNIFFNKGYIKFTNIFRKL